MLGHRALYYDVLQYFSVYCLVGKFILPRVVRLALTFMDKRRICGSGWDTIEVLFWSITVDWGGVSPLGPSASGR